MKNVLSVEQMQTLIDLGVDVSGASMFYKRGIWNGQDFDCKLLLVGEKEPFLIRRNDIPTFDLGDILEVLPKILYLKNNKVVQYNEFHYGILSMFYMDEKYHCSYIDLDGAEFFTKSDKTWIDVAHQMLLWCIENGHLKTK